MNNKKNNVYHLALYKESNDINKLDEIYTKLQSMYTDNDVVYLYYSREDIEGLENIVCFVTKLCLDGYNVRYAGRLGYNKTKGLDCVDNYLKIVLDNRDSVHNILNFSLDIDFYSNMLDGLFGITVVRLTRSDDLDCTGGNLKGIYWKSVKDFVSDLEVQRLKAMISKRDKVVIYDSENLCRFDFNVVDKDLLLNLKDEKTLHLVVGTSRVVMCKNDRYLNLNSTASVKDKLSKVLKIQKHTILGLNLDLGVSTLKEIADKFIALLGIYTRELGKSLLILSRDSYFINLNTIYNKDIVDTYSMYITYMFIKGYSTRIDLCKSKSITNERWSYLNKLKLLNVGVNFNYFKDWGVSFNNILKTFTELRPLVNNL